jgi:hypothetical protein
MVSFELPEGGREAQSAWPPLTGHAIQDWCSGPHLPATLRNPEVSGLHLILGALRRLPPAVSRSRVKEPLTPAPLPAPSGERGRGEGRVTQGRSAGGPTLG